MELTEKDMKFLAIMNETRLSDGKMFGRYFNEIKELFSFSDSELNAAVKKLVKMGMLSVIDVGGNELIYFHTNKVIKDDLDTSLSRVRH